ncbi:MAG: UTP--glucose-1-phosphate uridylyltransferase GalU [Patescibacteria group bacterium]|jgi:UTP--glucose-1-phosphate uridylyltransferase
MKKIRKAVIPAAGFGTRFLPATKAMPKEMMPVVDKPVIQYVVENAVASGIEQIIIITGLNKRAIEDHFDYNFELEMRLSESGKDEELKQIRAISDMCKFVYVRQKEQKGTGHAILCAKDVVGNEPFVVLWGDDFFYTKGKVHCQQLIDVYNKNGGSVLSVVERAEKEDSYKYGFIKHGEQKDDIIKVEALVEKPGPEAQPSKLATMSGFLLSPQIFDILEKQEPGKGGEIWLSDAINRLCQIDDVFAKKIDGKHYDCGNKLSYVIANIEMALEREEFNGKLVNYLKSLQN